MNQIISPTSDPALTAVTFSNNSHLNAALARLQARQTKPAPVMGGQESGGSDATDPFAGEERTAASLTFQYLYQVETKTGSGITSETIHVAADDMCDAIQKAIAQLVEHHADGVRVVACREMKKRGGA